jgi:8-oxo-dGTP pyrophosphatase MutT (NUDIX family)
MGREAVCVLIRGDEGTVLSVSRCFDRHDLGLPGGGVEAVDGDLAQDRPATLARAAARELREECGVEVDPAALEPVFDSQVGATRVTTFAPRSAIDRATVKLGFRLEGRVAWATVDAVCAGSYGEYNRALFAALSSPR